MSKDGFELPTPGLSELTPPPHGVRSLDEFHSHVAWYTKICLLSRPSCTRRL